MFRYKIQAIAEAVQKLIFLQNQVIGRRYHHACIRIDGMNMMRGVSDARRGIASAGFQKNLFGFQLGQLLQCEIVISLIGNNINVFYRYNFLDAVEGLLYKRTARAEKVEKLFGIRTAAGRPKTTADTATHDDTIMVFHIVLEFVRKILFLSDDVNYFRPSFLDFF